MERIVADREATLRRNMEQARHCVQEALSVVEHMEDLRCAMDDMLHASDLCQFIIRELKRKLDSLNLEY